MNQEIFDYLSENLEIELEVDYWGYLRVTLKLKNPDTNTYEYISSDSVGLPDKERSE